MAEPGGYQQPRNPAPVPMPGRLSRRTDGGPQQTTTEMTGMGYGENADFNDIQSSAPVAATPPLERVQPAGGRRARRAVGGPSVTPLMAPTQRPSEPVTAGAPFGPGRTVSDQDRDMQMQAARRPTVIDTLTKVAPYDRTGRLQSVVNYLRSM